MNRYLPFNSRCPNCAYEWLQDAYTRGALLKLFGSDAGVEAYCIRCAVLWRINADEERTLRLELTESLQVHPPWRDPHTLQSEKP